MKRFLWNMLIGFSTAGVLILVAGLMLAIIYIIAAINCHVLIKVVILVWLWLGIAIGWVWSKEA